MLEPLADGFPKYAKGKYAGAAEHLLVDLQKLAEMVGA